LLVQLDEAVRRPGESAVLHLADAPALAPGTHALRIAGEDGRDRVVLELPITVDKAGFSLRAGTPLQQVIAGGEVVYALDVAAHLGWTGPVTLRVDDALLAAGIAAAFRLTGAGVRATMAEIVVTPPQRVYLAVTTTRTVAMGSYAISLLGLAGEQAHALDLWLDVGEQPAVHLPLIRK